MHASERQFRRIAEKIHEDAAWKHSRQGSADFDVLFLFLATLLEKVLLQSRRASLERRILQSQEARLAHRVEEATVGRVVLTAAELILWDDLADCNDLALSEAQLGGYCIQALLQLGCANQAVALHIHFVNLLQTSLADAL